MDRMTPDQALFQRDGYQQAYERCRAQMDTERAQYRTHLEAVKSKYQRELDAAHARVAELEGAAQTVCAALDDAGRLHATTGGPELAALTGHGLDVETA